MPAKYAVLIGINKYPHYGEKMQLAGCVNDAKRMKSVLVEHFDFDATNICELHDEAATRAAILGALDHLVEVAREDDIVVLHYSGHGRRRKAKLRKNSELRPTDGEWFDKSEGTGYDSTLMPSDTGPRPHPHLDITDNTIHNWLERLTGITRNVTLIFDACHSGTVTRSSDNDARARTVPEDDRSPEELAQFAPEPNAPSLAAGAKRGKSGWLPLSDRYTVIAGSRDSETSKECDVSGASPFNRHGALSYHLTNALLESVPGTTHRDIFEVAGSKVTAWFKTQHPQAEGSLDREIFGTREIRPMHYIRLVPADDGKMALAGGAIQGLKTGSLWTVYPPGTKQTEGTEALGHLEVTDVGPFTSTVNIIDQSSEFLPNCRCVEQEPSATTETVQINNSKGELDVQFNIFRVLPDATLEPANEAGFEFQEGDRLAFELVNNQNHAVFACILNVGLNGETTQLYPRRKANEMMAGSASILKGADRAKLRVNLKGFAGDRGTQTYKAFFATQPIDLAWQCRDRSLNKPSPRKPKQLSARRPKETTRSTKKPGEALSARDDWLTVSRPIVVKRSTR